MLSCTLQVSRKVDPGLRYFSDGPDIAAFDSVTSSLMNIEMLG